MTSHLRLLVLAPTLLIGGLLAACGDTDDDATTQDTPSTTAATGGDTGGADYGSPGAGGDASGTSIVAEDFAFSSLTVPAGAEVTFENADDAAHTVTADDGAFDTGDVAGGESATFTAPSDPGEYAFHCEIHPSMTGTLTVEA